MICNFDGKDVSPLLNKEFLSLRLQPVKQCGKKERVVVLAARGEEVTELRSDGGLHLGLDGKLLGLFALVVSASD